MVAAARARTIGLVCGALVGAAALLKPTALLWIPVVVLCARRNEGPRAKGGGSPARFVAGLVAPAAAAAAWLGAIGALGAACDAVFGWNAAAIGAAVRDASRTGPPGFAASVLSPRALAALLFDGIVLLGPFLGFAAIGAFVARRRALTLLWLATAVASVIVQQKFYRYQYAPVLTPLCVLAGAGIASLSAPAERALGRRLAAAATALVVAASLVPFGGVAVRYWRSHEHALPFPSGAARERFLSTYNWADPPSSHDEAAQVAARIRAASEPDERLLVLGFDPQVYLLADRSPGGRYLASDHLRSPGAEERLVSDLDRRRPRWIVVATDRVASSDFPRVTEWIAAHTAPRETIGRYALFERAR
jgi:hypothetical protein